MRKVFNLISIVMLLWTIISGAYLALPEEYKAMIPEFNWLTALVSGGSTGLIGGAMLLVDGFLKRSKSEYDTKYYELAKKFLELNDKYLVIENQNNILIEAQNRSNELLETNNRLLSIDLESKLTNPVVENFVKEKIRGEGIGNKDDE